MSEDDKPAPPRAIGRYEVIAEIASGGMGVVYLARHAGEAGFQRLVAIKLMHPHLAADKLFVDMLRDEARIAAHIHHPNVVPILDIGSAEGRYYVVMEFIDGCSLASLLGRNKPKRPPELVVPIVIDALEGLHAAHTLRDVDGNELKLVHRDVSPQNILLGVDGTARITDFGIAKAETRITSTRPGMRKGKLSYMAPEQLRDDGENIDHRADVFAAGALLWGALTAQPLFRGTSDASTLHNILNKNIPPPSTVGLHPPQIFDVICLKALERAPSKRFDSALEMADALREALVTLGLKSSRAKVATWVKESFAAELTARQHAIRRVTQRSQPPNADESLPALPVVGASASLTGSLPAFTPPPQSVTTPEGFAAAPASATPPSLTNVSSSHTLHPASEDPTQPDLRPKKKLLIAAALGLGSLAILIIFLATRSGPEQASAATTPAPAATTEKTSAVPPPTAKAEPQPEPTAAPEPVAPTTAEPVRPRTTARAPVRPRTSTTPKPVAKSETKTAPTATATAAPKPTSTSTATATGVKIEKNPYLRRD